MNRCRPEKKDTNEHGTMLKIIPKTKKESRRTEMLKDGKSSGFQAAHLHHHKFGNGQTGIGHEVGRAKLSIKEYYSHSA